MIKNNIKKYRNIIGWTREKLALEMGYKNVRSGGHVIFQWEKGIRTPNLTSLQRLAKALKVDTKELI